MMAGQRLGTKTYYALRCRDTGKFLDPHGMKFIERDYPTAPVRKMSTARNQRLRAINDSGVACLIDIERVVIASEILDRVPEDDRITQRMIDLCADRSYGGKQIAEAIEVPMRGSERAAAMRYALLLARLDLAKQAIEALKGIADVARYGEVLLLAGDADLVASKMHDEIRAVMIFDFEARRPLALHTT